MTNLGAAACICIKTALQVWVITTIDIIMIVIIDHH